MQHQRPTIVSALLPLILVSGCGSSRAAQPPPASPSIAAPDASFVRSSDASPEDAPSVRTDAASSEAPPATSFEPRSAAPACLGFTADHATAILLVREVGPGPHERLRLVATRIASERSVHEPPFPIDVGARDFDLGPESSRQVVPPGYLAARAVIDAALHDGRLIACESAQCQAASVAHEQGTFRDCTASPGGAVMHLRERPWTPEVRTITHGHGGTTVIGISSEIRSDWSAITVERDHPDGTWSTLYEAGHRAGEGGYHHLAGVFFDPAAARLVLVTEAAGMSATSESAVVFDSASSERHPRIGTGPGPQF